MIDVCVGDLCSLEVKHVWGMCVCVGELFSLEVKCGGCVCWRAL